MQSRNYVESSIVEIGEPGEHWNPSRHTVPLPTDAYGCIDFRGGSQTNKAQVGIAGMQMTTHVAFIFQLEPFFMRRTLNKLVPLANEGKLF